jgi:murein L,D-transpeptidase YcbB/YkuD
VAAILTVLGRSAEFCAAHKEYAPARKPNDPRFDMDEFRAEVTAIMRGEVPPLVPIPPIDTKDRPTLRRGDRGPDVARLQTILGITGPDVFGPRTEAAVREFQRKNNIVPDGIVGPKTWAVLEP